MIFHVVPRIIELASSPSKVNPFGTEVETAASNSLFLIVQNCGLQLHDVHLNEKSMKLLPTSRDSSMAVTAVHAQVKHCHRKPNSKDMSGRPVIVGNSNNSVPPPNAKLADAWSL